jgi:hypothetical protein
MPTSQPAGTTPGFAPARHARGEAAVAASAPLTAFLAPYRESCLPGGSEPPSGRRVE